MQGCEFIFFVVVIECFRFFTNKFIHFSKSTASVIIFMSLNKFLNILLKLLKVTYSPKVKIDLIPTKNAIVNNTKLNENRCSDFQFFFSFGFTNF